MEAKGVPVLFSVSVTLCKGAEIRIGLGLGRGKAAGRGKECGHLDLLKPPRFEDTERF